MSYYEHEIKVKIIDGVLSHSQEWDWFIEYTEERFDPNTEVRFFDDALLVYRELHPIFDFLCHIRKITDKQFNIKTNWLKDLDQLALFYVGTLTLDDVVVDLEFSKIQLILIYCGKIYGQISGNKRYFYAEIFKIRNLHLLFNVDLFADEKETIERLFNNTSVDTRDAYNCYESNIKKEFYPAKKDFIEKHEADFYSADCFSHKQFKAENVATWEEQELLNMLMVSYSNDRIIPLFSNGDQHTPEYEVWTESLIDHIIDYFDSESVTFIAESIKYALYKVVPSPKTLNKHFELFCKLSSTISDEDTHKLYCSSLEFIKAFFNNKQIKSVSKECLKNFSDVLNKFLEWECYRILYDLKNHGALINPKVREQLNLQIQKELNNVDKISNIHELITFIKDKRLRHSIDNNHLTALSSTFDEVIRSSEMLHVTSLFLDYFLFLLKVKNNKNVNSLFVSQEIIRIRKLWQQEFYAKSVQSMSKITSGSFTIPRDSGENYLHYFLINPYNCLLNSVKLNDGALIGCMCNISENPLMSMVSKIMIAEDFPQKPFLKIDGKHPIDKFYLKEIDRLKNEYGYKLLNQLKSTEFIDGVYEIIKMEMRFKMALINEITSLYDAVQQQNPNCEFVKLEDKVLLAHVTQLFPLLENKIREFGEMCGIVPVCESEDKCHRLKEPDSVLNSIISDADKMEVPLSTVADLFFIHFCMYGENGFNIRNDCIHGNGYWNEEQILFAFKVTLFCLYSIGSRCDAVLENE